MDLNNEGNKIISECLGNPVILKKVMQNFSNTGLLTLSLVNKLWNYEAKTVMKNRGNLFPSFNWVHDDRPMCQILRAFASDLRRMTVVPFRGIRLAQCDQYGHKCPSYTGKLDPSYEIILDRLPRTHFSMVLDSGFLFHPKCPTTLLAKRVMRDFSSGLEEFSVSLNFCHEQFIQKFVQEFSFPHLKVLRIGLEFTGTSKDAVKLIRPIVSRAPNLQELRTNLSGKFMDEALKEALEGSAAVLIPQCFNPFTCDAQLPESFANVLRLERMTLLPYYENVSVDIFNRIVPVLLQTHRWTLHYLCIHIIYVGPLMSYGISLPNVKKFQIEMYGRVKPTQPEVVLLKDFDFTRILPSLTTVDIKGSRRAHPRIPEFMEQGNDECREPMHDRAAQVKHLHLTDCFNQDTAPFLSDIFPNIKKLSVKQTSNCAGVQCGLFWEHWAELQKLEVTVRNYVDMNFMNFDSDLCGLFPEEVAELIEKDDEYLKSVNVVPVKPAILCFKGLRTLKLICEEQRACSLKEDPTFLCSRVPGIMAFARCPNLSVTIQANLPELEKALGHLKPYATILLERTDWNMRY